MKGILFRPEMIKAIREGRKMVTRRVIKATFDIEKGDNITRFAPYQVGEVVYIKEGIHRFHIEYASYDSDFTPVMFLQSANRFHWRWTRDKLSPMFLPHEAARLFLKINNVKAERLCLPLSSKELESEGGEDAIPLLEKMNGKWVWVYSFRKV